MNFLGFRFRRDKVKRYVIFLSTDNDGSFRYEKRKRLRRGNVSVKWRVNDSRNIDITLNTFERGLKRYYFFDVSSNKQLTFNLTQESFNPTLNDLHRRGGVVKDLIAGLERRKEYGLILGACFVFLALGLAVGWILGNIFPLEAFI